MRRVLKPGGTLLLTVPCGAGRDYGVFQQFDEGLLFAGNRGVRSIGAGLHGVLSIHGGRLEHGRPGGGGGCPVKST